MIRSTCLVSQGSQINCRKSVVGRAANDIVRRRVVQRVIVSAAGERLGPMNFARVCSFNIVDIGARSHRIELQSRRASTTLYVLVSSPHRMLVDGVCLDQSP